MGNGRQRLVTRQDVRARLSLGAEPCSLHVRGRKMVGGTRSTYDLELPLRPKAPAPCGSVVGPLVDGVRCDPHQAL